MKIKEIIEIVNARVLTEFCNEEKEFEYAFASDLMSDVLAYANDETLLITGLSNPQVIRTAEIMDISAVLFVRGKVPNSDIIDLAVENSLTILATDNIMFETCGLLYKNGMKGNRKWQTTY